MHPNLIINPYNKALYALLLCQALDKNDIKVESDSLIRIATNYFKENDPVHAGYAWLYMARCAHNRGDGEQEANALFKAQDFAEKTDNNKLLGLVYGDKSNLYGAQGETDSLITYGKLSYRTFKKIDDTYNCIVNLLIIGQQYLNSNQLDSALLYTVLAENMSKSLNDKIINSTIHRSLGLLYSKKGNNEMALHYLNSAPITHISIYDYNTWYIKARILIKTGESDSARYYLNKVRKPGEMARDYYYQWQKLYEKEGNFKKALFYANKRTDAIDSLNARKLEVSFAGLEKKYKYEKLKVENNNLIIRNKQNSVYLFMVLFFTSLLILVVLLRRFRVKKHELELQKQFVENEKKIAEKEKENNYLLEQQLKMQTVLLKNVDNFRRKAIKRPDEHDKLSNSEIEATNNIFHDELITNIDAIYKNISKRLATVYPKLTQRDVLICCLLVANFDTGMIATILDIKIESMNMHRMRLRKKLQLQNIDNLIEFLRNF
jgi:DNA-binding CsgD family transcriptional regulator